MRIWENHQLKTLAHISYLQCRKHNISKPNIPAQELGTLQDENSTITRTRLRSSSLRENCNFMCTCPPPLMEKTSSQDPFSMICIVWISTPQKPIQSNHTMQFSLWVQSSNSTKIDSNITHLDELSHSPQHQEEQQLSFLEFWLWGCQNIINFLFTYMLKWSLLQLTRFLKFKLKIRIITKRSSLCPMSGTASSPSKLVRKHRKIRILLHQETPLEKEKLWGFHPFYLWGILQKALMKMKRPWIQELQNSQYFV